MKGQFLSLLRFYLKNGSWMLWLQVAAYLLWLFFPISPLVVGVEGMKQATGEVSLPALWTMLVGFCLFANRTNWKETSPGLPQAEYLLTRPVTRRAAYGVASFLFYGLVLLPPLAFGGWQAVRPDLNVSLLSHQDVQRSTLQMWFPHTQIRGPNVTILGGRVLFAAWKLAVIFSVAMATQVFFLLRLPGKARQAGWFVVMALWVLFQSRPDKLSFPLFLLFSAHQLLAWLTLLLLFATVQTYAWRRAARIEVI